MIVLPFFLQKKQETKDVRAAGSIGKKRGRGVVRGQCGLMVVDGDGEGRGRGGGR